MIVGLIVSIPAAMASEPLAAGPETWFLLGLVGVAYNLGLLLAYAALMSGRVSIVAPIVATEGAGAAAISVVLGDPLTVPVAVVLAVIATGIVLSAIERGGGEAAQRAGRDPGADRRTVLLSVASAIVFAVGLVAAAPFVVLSGFLEATGTVSYVLGAQHGLAIAAVLSSQFAAIAAVAAYFLYRERLQRVQVAGVAIIVLGISALAIVRT
jgi:uncharacterized membrane protein